MEEGVLETTKAKDFLGSVRNICQLLQNVDNFEKCIGLLITKVSFERAAQDIKIYKQDVQKNKITLLKKI